MARRSIVTNMELLKLRYLHLKMFPNLIPLSSVDLKPFQQTDILMKHKRKTT